MIHNSAPAAHAWLRQTTAAAHARVDGIVGRGLHTAADYAAYLRGMHRFVVIAEGTLEASDIDLATRRWWLADDLAALGVSPLPAAAPGSGSGWLPVAVDPLTRLGWEYVLAGASIGARYLLRNAHVLGYSARHGAQFLAGHAASDDWPAFLTRLERAGLEANELPGLSDAALAAFAIAERGFRLAFGPVPAVSTLPLTTTAAPRSPQQEAP